MRIAIIENGEQRVFYSEDVIERIRELNQELMETYPECTEYCLKMEKTINEI